MRSHNFVQVSQRKISSLDVKKFLHVKAVNRALQLLPSDPVVLSPGSPTPHHLLHLLLYHHLDNNDPNATSLCLK